MRYTPLIFLLLTLIRCANVIPPEGGPRDTIPPILLRSEPKNNSKDFRGDKITLEFNEWINLKNAKEEVIITPSMGKATKFLFRKNIATIVPELKLDTETTYSISFRDVVQDLNEGNPAEDLKIAFSTGSIIDSLKIFGSVYHALEGTPIDKLNVAIYTTDTFNITKHTPSYISRTDKKGRFTITNLKAGQYYVYAWDDKNKNLKVETNSERFGTWPIKVSLPENGDSIKIPVVKLDSRQLKLNNYRNISNYTIIRLNKAPVNYFIASERRVINHFSNAPNEIIAYPPVSHPDSIRIRLKAIDSLSNEIDSTFYIKQTKSKPIKETFTAKFDYATYTAPYKTLKASIQYNIPLKGINTDSLIIRIDTVYLDRLQQNDIKMDTIKNRLIINKLINIQDSLLLKNLNLSIRETGLVSIFNDTLKTIDQRIIPRLEKDLATITITSKKKSNNWIVEVVNDRFEILQSQAHNKMLIFKHLDPVNIKIRAYYDANGNNMWDINNPLQRKEPEKYIYYRNEKGQTSTPLRSNWSVELLWDF